MIRTLVAAALWLAIPASGAAFSPPAMPATASSDTGRNVSVGIRRSAREPRAIGITPPRVTPRRRSPPSGRGEALLKGGIGSAPALTLPMVTGDGGGDGGGGDGAEGGRVTVAVIGGGIAGLTCADYLSRSGRVDPTVFDTGRLRPGGRCSSRLPGDRPKDRKASRDTILGSSVIDHAAQILTVPAAAGFGRFRAQVERWEEEGVVRRYPLGSVCEILGNGDDGGGFSLRRIGQEENAMYYGVGGMNAIPAAILREGKENPGFRIEQDVWVSPSNGVRFVGGPSKPQWKISCNGRQLGIFDRLIIAHNGKCADRIMSRTPAKALHSLLRTNFAPTVPKSGGKRMTLNSIYSLTFVIKKEGSPLTRALGDDVICGFIKNNAKLRFITCQSRKHHGSNGVAKDQVEIWTVLSSPQFAKKHKAPQENIPEDTKTEVIDLLLNSLTENLDLSGGGLSREGLLDSKLQLWGAAVPLNTWSSMNKNEESSEPSSSGFLYDPENGVGAAGDWLLDPSIGGAWESGRRLAEWIIAEAESNDKGERSIGLPPNGAFRVSEATAEAGIGNVK